MIDGLFLFCLFIVPGPLSIKFMTTGFVQAEIDKLKGDRQYTTKFTSEFVRKKDALHHLLNLQDLQSSLLHPLLLQLKGQ